MPDLDEEEKIKFSKLYRERVNFLRNNIPPDDIYEFAEQALISAQCFLQLLSNHIDIDEKTQQDNNFAFWVDFLLSLRQKHKKNYLGGISVAMIPKEYE